MSIRDEKWTAGTPCWVDLSTTDPDGARTFYGDLFGWDLQVGSPETGHYTMALKDGRPAAAINGMPAPDGQHTAWVTYLATDDLDVTWAGAMAAGANQVMAPDDVMTFGRMAFAVDPAGAVFGMWQAGDHTGFQVCNEASTVSWNELMTRDYEGAKSFYGNVFGHKYDVVEMPPEFQYSTFNVGADMVGGIGTLPAEVPAEVPPHWNVYFGTDDADETIAAVTRLGGSVLQPVMDTPYGRLAQVRDPQGAVFSIRQAPSE